MSAFEHLLHILFENSETIVFWLGGSLAAGAATYLWILSAYSPALSLLRTGAIAGCAAIFVPFANIFLRAVNGARISVPYWTALTVVYAVQLGIRVMAGGLAIRRRWLGHPGLGIIVSLSTMAIIFFAIILHLPRNVFGDPLEPPRQGLIGQLFMIAGWGIALILHPKSRPVLYGQVEGLWLPGRAWLASFSQRRALTTPASLGFNFLYKWTVASSAAWLFAFYTAFALYSFGRIRAPNPTPIGTLAFALDFAVVFALAGFCMGGVQWLFLRNILPRCGWWWIAGTASGFYLAELGVQVLHAMRFWGLAIIGLSAGLLAGILQIQTLKSGLPRTWQWLIVSSVGFLAATALPIVATGLGIRHLIGGTGNAFYAAQGIGVVGMALITGAGLVRLSRIGRKQSA